MHSKRHYKRMEVAVKKPPKNLWVVLHNNGEEKPIYFHTKKDAEMEVSALKAFGRRCYRCVKYTLSGEKK